MATIRKRGAAYEISVCTGRDKSGKQIRKSTTWKPLEGLSKHEEKRELEAFAADFEARARGDKILDGEHMKYGEYIAEYWMPYAKKRLAATTYEADCSELRLYILPAIGNIALAKIKKLHLVKLYDDLLDRGLATGTVRRVHSTMIPTESW